jgi:hypothetical protein
VHPVARLCAGSAQFGNRDALTHPRAFLLESACHLSTC